MTPTEYRENGVSRHVLRDQVRTNVALEITRDEWLPVAPGYPTTITGFKACRQMFEAAS